MSLILLRQKARELHAKRRRQLLGALTVPVVVAFFYGFSIYQFPDLREVLHALFILALAWSIAGLYFLKLGKWSREMPEDAGFSTGLEFCKRELERRRNYLRRVLLWSLGPILLAIAAFLVTPAIAVGGAMFFKAAPFVALVVIWIASFFLIRAWQQREVQREIDELSEIDIGNGR
ncbi:MAG: hypothetical protein ACREBW_08745 [Candidatus Micrarchaeaceae archaeon]